MNNFALIGAAGYIAPRHMEAIYHTGNRILCVTDPHDSVGILDKYDKDIKYFKDIERFDRHIDMLYRTSDESVDYVSICSPNYLHDAHCRLAVRNHANVICEKPLVINPWNLDSLEELEQEYGKKIYPIMQMRYHPKILELKNVINDSTYYNCAVRYFTPRGMWYYHSWKGEKDKSGGILMNIGIHLFDIILWLFGEPVEWSVEILDDSMTVGRVEFKNATVKWYMSIGSKFAPMRLMTVNDRNIDFSNVDGLHIKQYNDILMGRGYSISDVRPSIEFVYKVRYGNLY
jgi:UDP-N-acetyl-2-amino-2-deoxyglucuronate dehydrogenase